MKTVKLNRIEKALIALAGHVDSNPFNEYKVKQEILDILGLEFVPEKPKQPPSKKNLTL